MGLKGSGSLIEFRDTIPNLPECQRHRNPQVNLFSKQELPLEASRATGLIGITPTE